jgi:nucleoside-diphosphate-sugar epimerase
MIGFRIIYEALLAGYKVRAAVRKQKGFEQIKAARPVQPYLSQLEHILVPDILADGAYDEAVRGATYIIHVASPITHPEHTDWENDIMKPAVKGTVGILQSAMLEPKVKRIVITSSITASISYKDIITDTTTIFSGQPFHPS